MKPPRFITGELFIRRPIPLWWMAAAGHLGGKALLVSFCRETRKLLLRQGLTISRTIRPQTDFAGACESRSHKAVCAVRCPGWFVIGSIYRPQLMQEQI